MNKIVPINKSYCDCCMEEEKIIKRCPNEKCKYVMCVDCIEDLKRKTSSNKCPNCRGELFNMNELVVIEIEDTQEELERSIRFWFCNRAYDYQFENTNNRIINYLIKKITKLITYIAIKPLCCPVLYIILFFIKSFEFFLSFRNKVGLNYNNDFFILKKKIFFTKILADTLSIFSFSTLIFGLMCFCVFYYNFLMHFDLDRNIFCDLPCFFLNFLAGLCLTILSLALSTLFIYIVMQLLCCLLSCERGGYISDDDLL